MHPNAQTLQRLYTAFAQLDHATMAACYAPDATFDDEAFSLRGRDEIGGVPFGVEMNIVALVGAIFQHHGVISFAVQGLPEIGGVQIHPALGRRRGQAEHIEHNRRRTQVVQDEALQRHLALANAQLQRADGHGWADQQGVTVRAGIQHGRLLRAVIDGDLEGRSLRSPIHHLKLPHDLPSVGAAQVEP